MTDKKLTDEEIKKALECCGALDKGCQKCLYNETFGSICIHFLCEDALDLINRLQAENEELAYKLGCLLCHATGGKLSKHTYSLGTMESYVNDNIQEYCEEAEAEAKAEAYKEFAERVQKKIDPTLIAVTMIGNILVEVSKSHISADNAIEKIREYLKDLEIETRLSFDMAVCNLLKEMIGE